MESKTTNFYQTVGFHFAVAFDGETNFEGIDARFQSVSGLDASLETESLKEGGENRFEHVLPVRRKYSPLVLKRGLLALKDDSALTWWCIDAFEYQIVEPKNLDVALLDENHNVLIKWKVIHAWPKSWKVGELNAEKSEVLIETLELNYNRFEYF